jgi:sortase A
MVGGVVLAILRVVEPDKTALSVPVTETPVPILPTQGSLFESTIAPPPLIPNMDIPIMPIMIVEDVISPTPITPTITPTRTRTSTLRPTATTTTKASDTPLPSLSSHTPTPSISPTATITLSPTPILTSTPRPTFAPDNITTPLPVRPSSTPSALIAVPERIEIPEIDLDAPVISVGWHTVPIDGQVFSRWDVPDEFATGWHNSSAYLGQAGNTVINGHHNAWGHVFGKLINVEPGDQVIIYSEGESFNYTVVQTMILEEENQPLSVRIENARWLLPSPDERVTLVTCWPQTNFTHRLVVIALPTDQVERQLQNIPPQNGNNRAPTP